LRWKNATEQIFSKNYTFIVINFFPTYFLIYQKNLELQIKLQFIQSYSTESLKKPFYLNQILNRYKEVNNQKKAQLT
jgi:hypothetical protein